MQSGQSPLNKHIACNLTVEVVQRQLTTIPRCCTRRPPCPYRLTTGGRHKQYLNTCPPHNPSTRLRNESSVFRAILLKEPVVERDRHVQERGRPRGLQPRLEQDALFLGPGPAGVAVGRRPDSTGPAEPSCSRGVLRRQVCNNASRPDHLVHRSDGGVREAEANTRLDP